MVWLCATSLNLPLHVTLANHSILDICFALSNSNRALWDLLCYSLSTLVLWHFESCLHFLDKFDVFRHQVTLSAWLWTNVKWPSSASRRSRSIWSSQISSLLPSTLVFQTRTKLGKMSHIFEQTSVSVSISLFGPFISTSSMGESRKMFADYI